MTCNKNIGILKIWIYLNHVSNKCDDVLISAYELKKIATLNVKGVDFRCIL